MMDSEAIPVVRARGMKPVARSTLFQGGRT
jgi:hypothetical protein